jgi:hypothetical protein
MQRYEMGKALMGHLQFLNQDGEWESFPSPEQEANLRANAELLEELGYKLICQMCNKFPNALQIRQRYLKHEWTCEGCGTVNSAGKA